MPIQLRKMIINNKEYLQFQYTYYNKLVGTLEIAPYEQNREGIVGVNLKSIYTDPAYRGKGYASKLMLALIEYCRKNGIRYIITDDATDAPRLRNIYYKFGFLVKNDDDKWVKWTDDIIPDEERLLFV
jgi:GNAT superfamily N-acetyltransferase